ncbi:MAG: acyltransferase family protein [Candidatus Synoicihabitans palmerolidicus]|nr:acyltransferase family protein [Candidatus Synoicihabitans palmerolidicus]
MGPPHNQRIVHLRFLLIVGVVFIHAFDTQINFSTDTVSAAHQTGYSSFVRTIISQGIARTAVPIFYFLAGYLFFLHFTWSWKSYRRKLGSRIHTLLIPFLC